MGRTAEVPADAEPQTLSEIMEWHRDLRDALLLRRATIRDAIFQSSHVPERFSGMTEEDVEAWFHACRRELDRLTVLNLVASSEASLKIDFFRRVHEKRKDPLAQIYRAWFKSLSRKKKQRPDFDEGGILDHLKRSKAVDPNIVGAFRECLRVRHWVGHGRYWSKPSEIDRFSPEEVFIRGQALLSALPA